MLPWIFNEQKWTLYFGQLSVLPSLNIQWTKIDLTLRSAIRYSFLEYSMNRWTWHYGQPSLNIQRTIEFLCYMVSSLASFVGYSRNRGGLYIMVSYQICLPWIFNEQLDSIIWSAIMLVLLDIQRTKVEFTLWSTIRSAFLEYSTNSWTL